MAKVFLEKISLKWIFFIGSNIEHAMITHDWLSKFVAKG
jgi:hypothetical protein